MVSVGNFLFHYRNGIFPLIYVLLVFKSRPVLPDYGLAALIGVLLALNGQLLRSITIGLEYIVRGGRNRRVYARELVQGGIFGHCRNPLYVGNFLIVAGVGLVSNSTLFVTVAIPFFAFTYLAIIAAEEDYLRQKFGAEYENYCARVPRLLPSFSGIGQTLSGMRFNWGRLVGSEYGSAYIWIAAVLLVSLKNLWFNGQWRTNQPLVASLALLFLALTLAYAFARFLKKSGRLKG